MGHNAPHNLDVGDPTSLGGVADLCTDTLVTELPIGVPPPLERLWKKQGWRKLGSTYPAATPMCHSTSPRGQYLTYHCQRRGGQAIQRPFYGRNMRSYGLVMMGGGRMSRRRGRRNNHLLLIHIIYLWSLTDLWPLIRVKKLPPIKFEHTTEGRSMVK